MTLFLLAIGLAVLIVSGTMLVDGASNIAVRHKIPPAVIGLTLVAFGTSVPELAVNISAVSGDNTDLSLGNIFGSNIANLGLVLGAALTIRGLNVESQIMRREIPLLLLGSMVVLVMCSDFSLRGTPSVLDRADALILLLFFLIFVYVNLSDILVDRVEDPLIRQAAQQSDPLLGNRNYLYVTLGIVGLVLGARLTVENGVSLAKTVGVSETVIGLSLVAVGTSIPELVTSIIAATRNQASLAVGNVVGSNLINSLLILPLSALISDLPVSRGSLLDVWASLLFAVVLLLIARLTDLTLNRFHGICLLLAYLVYMVLRFAGVGQ